MVLGMHLYKSIKLKLGVQYQLDRLLLPLHAVSNWYDHALYFRSSLVG